jgi:DegV family protein with EDD domain
VRRTPALLPELQGAGVVDAGALGMFIFLEGFFGRLFEADRPFAPITERFKGQLRVSPAFSSRAVGHCISALVETADGGADPAGVLAGCGESLVTSRERACLKIHVHAPDPAAVRKKIGALGRIVDWTEEEMAHGVLAGASPGAAAMHLMTDGAGSITRADAAELGITLLDSYILMGEEALPETRISPPALYRAMAGGARVSTAQASVFERHQHYQSALSRHPRVLYLCVGSAYTGNYGTAMAWKAEHDPEDHFTVMDTGAASGRLGAAVLAAARFNLRSRDPEAVIRFARAAVDRCEEYVFLDRLRYLAAGGRLSRTGAFFGDALHLKPVVSPTAEGARKVGVVRDPKGQVAFALERLRRIRENGPLMFILLEYSDNRTWLEAEVQAGMKRQSPETDILVRPLSLTSGAHMGPGAWAAAFMPQI